MLGQTLPALLQYIIERPSRAWVAVQDWVIESQNTCLSRDIFFLLHATATYFVVIVVSVPFHVYVDRLRNVCQLPSLVHTQQLERSKGTEGT